MDMLLELEELGMPALPIEAFQALSSDFRGQESVLYELDANKRKEILCSVEDEPEFVRNIVVGVLDDVHLDADVFCEKFGVRPAVRDFLLNAVREHGGDAEASSE